MWTQWLESRADDQEKLGSNPTAWCRFGTLAISLTQLSQCLLEETLKVFGPFYLVSMPGEVNDHTQITHVTTLKKNLHIMVSKLIVSSIVRRKERLHHLTTQIVMPTWPFLSHDLSFVQSYQPINDYYLLLTEIKCFSKEASIWLPGFNFRLDLARSISPLPSENTCWAQYGWLPLLSAP